MKIAGLLLFSLVTAMEAANSCNPCHKDELGRAWNNLIDIDFSNYPPQQIQKDKTFVVMGYTIPSKYKNTLDRAFDTDNVRVENGTAELTVQDRNGRMTSGSFGTRRADILYGSFRAVMKITDEPGTVGAFYFFRDNKHELDIELLSRNKHPWQAYFAAHPQIYNQDGSASQLTHGKYVLDNDLSSDYHEYRIDWLPNRAEFFVDGQKAHEFTTNVPDLPGRMLVNHWTDGNPNFSGGPPTKPATLSVKSLTYYFNTESDPAPSTNCPPTSCETSDVAPAATAAPKAEETRTEQQHQQRPSKGSKLRCGACLLSVVLQAIIFIISYMVL